MSDIIISCHNLSKSYKDGATTISVLNKINFAIQKGERIAIVGPSGSGKSTFLHLLGGLDFPTSGDVLMQDKNWKNLSEKERCQVRNKNLGFIYQFHHLLPEFSALENVMMPLVLSDDEIPQATTKADEILNQVGLGNRKDHKPSQLSGGERQRVAIARALVHQPKCVFADEPTGNLDHQTATKVFEMMLTLNKNFNTALVVVTHDTELAKKMDIIVSLQEGNLLIS